MGTIWQPTLPESVRPKYKAVVASITEGIESGGLQPDAKLPPVRELAWSLGITPGTVARAYSILTDAGVLRGEVGRGTFVARAGEIVQPVQTPKIESHVAGRYPEDSTATARLVSPRLPLVGQDVLIRKLLAEIAADPPSGIMRYPSREGAQPARAAVVRWLAGTPLGGLAEEDIVLSHGGQNGLQLIFQTILSGDQPVLLIEDLAYPGFRRAAELLRAEVVPVPMDDHGIIPEALEEVARRYKAQALCTSPEVHNPTGRFTPETRRAEIVDVARRVGFQIVEDDCYRMQADRAPTYRMLAPERGWYVSSLAKTVSPALRIGFAIAPEGRTSALRKVAEYNCFGLATPMIDLCAALLTHPDIDALTHQASTVVDDYIQIALNVLGRFEVTWRPHVPFLWLRLPVGWRAGAFCQAAEACGVQIRSAEEFVCREARAPHAVRIAINAELSPQRFEKAALKLRHLLDNPPERIGV